MKTKVLSGVRADLKLDDKVPGLDDGHIAAIADNLYNHRCDVLTEEQQSRLTHIVRMAKMEATRGGGQHPLWGVVSNGEAFLNGQSTELEGTAAEVFAQLDALFIQHTDSHI